MKLFILISEKLEISVSSNIKKDAMVRWDQMPNKACQWYDYL